MQNAKANNISGLNMRPQDELKAYK